MSNLPEYDALVARIESATPLKVYDAVRLTPKGELARELYVVAWPTTPYRVESERHTAAPGLHLTRWFDFDLRVIGTEARTTAVALQRVLESLVGHSLAAAGRSCDPLTLDDADSVQPDNTVTPPLFFADGTVSLISRPGGTP